MGQKLIGKRTSVPLMGATSGLKEEECASSMGQKSHDQDAARKDAKIKFKKEECASSMGRRDGSNHAPRKDAQMKLKEEEFAGSTEESPNVMRLNAQIKLSMEDCASCMGQRSNDASVKDAIL